VCILSDAVVPAQFFGPGLRQECCISGFVFISVECSLSHPKHVFLFRLRRYAVVSTQDLGPGQSSACLNVRLRVGR